MRDIYPIFVHLPDMFNDTPIQTLGEMSVLSDAAKAAGLQVGLVIDYWMKDPYHGAPPHLNPNNDYQLHQSERKRMEGRGYHPFSWRPGWGIAVDMIAQLITAIRPNFIQQGVDSTVMNWPTSLPPDKRHWGYNDVMGLFNNAIKKTDWTGTYVVSGFYNSSLRKAREYFGQSMKDSDFLDRCTLDLPDPPDDPVDPPDDDLEARIVFLENTMEEVLKCFYRIEAAIKAWGS